MNKIPARALLVTSILFSSSHAWALPLGGHSAHGAAQPQQSQQMEEYAVLPEAAHGAYTPPMPSAFDKNHLVTPGSDKQMKLSLSQVGGEVSKAESEADERLKTLGVGSGNLPAVDVEKTSLQEDLDAERTMKRLSVKTQEAKLAMGLWGIAYDGPREMKAVDSSAGGVSQAAPKSAAPEIDEETQKAEREMALNEKRNEFEEAQERKKEEERMKLAPYPVVSSLSGTGTDIQAVVLVPYFGAVTPKVGEYLPDTRHLLVQKITAQGVVCQSKDGRVFMLSTGASVPSELPTLDGKAKPKRGLSSL